MVAVFTEMELLGMTFQADDTHFPVAMEVSTVYSVQGVNILKKL